MKMQVSKDPKEVQEGVNELSSRGNRHGEGFEAAAYSACSRPSKEGSKGARVGERCGGRRGQRSN